MTPEITTLLKLETVAETDGAKKFDDRLKQNQRTIKSVTKDLQIQELMLRKKGRSYNYVKAHLAGATKEELKAILAHEKNIARMKEQDAQMAKNNKTLRMMRGGFGQVGHQVQDIAVQLQGGTDAMIVFGQQGSQIVSLFGPGGAALGALLAVGAALITSFKPAVDDSTESLEQIIQKIKEKKKELGLLSAAQKEYEAALKSKTLAEAEENNEKLNNQLAKQQKALKNVGIALAEAEKLSRHYNDGVLVATAETEHFEQQQANLEFAIKATQSALVDNQDVIDEYTEGTMTAAEAEKKRIKAVMELVDAGKKELATMNMSERELAVYEARQRGATIAQIATIDAIYKKIEANKAEQKATEEAQKAEKKRQDSINGVIKAAATQAATFGANKRELDIYTATLQGATEQEIASINALHDLVDARKNAAAVDSLVKSLQEQAAVVGMNSRELDVYKATQKGATEQEIASINSLHDLIDARKELTKEIKAQEKAQKDLQRAEEDAFTSGLNKVLARIEDKQLAARMAAEEEIAVAREAKDRGILNETQYAEAVLAIHRDLHDKLGELRGTSGEGPERTIVDVGTDFDALLESQKTELDLFREHQQKKLDLVTEHEDAVNDVMIDYAQMRKDIADETAAYELASQMMTQQQVLGIMQQQLSQLGGMFDKASALGKAFFVAQQALAAVQAIIQGELASMNILAANSAIPGGVPYAITMAAMAKAMGYASAAAIMGQTVASFEGGGITFNGVRSGGMDGRGGRLAMVHPNEKITDMEKAPPSEQPVNVNINIQAVDAKGIDELLVKRRGMITSLVRNSLNNTGARLG